jgi:urease subunit beta
MIPGEWKLREEDIVCNEGRRVCSLAVLNTGDRPVQIGSHFHFYEVNEALRFDREAALGMRLNVPAGSAVRFEPGDARTVELVALGGKREVYGLNRKTNGYAGRE